MAVSAVARVVALLRLAGATEDEIFAYLTDKRSGVGLPKREAITYLVWQDLIYTQTSALVEGGGAAGQVAISAVFPADFVRQNVQSEPFFFLGCWGWVFIAIVLLVVLLLFFTDPLMSFICTAGWDSSNHVACRHANLLQTQ